MVRCTSTIVALYVALWVAAHLLIYSSKTTDAPKYNATSVVLATELAKLALALALFRAHDGDTTHMRAIMRGHPRMPLKYAVPALLYAAYNNLVYTNLSHFDPGTYNVLLQLRIALTGVTHQCFFSRLLSRDQWLAIGAITLAAVLKESDTLASAAPASAAAYALLLVQMLCSVVAGVYNEVLLKSGGDEMGARVPTNLQNAYMYFNSIVVNVVILAASGQLREAVSAENLATVLSARLVAVILIMSTVGIVTGFFLRHLDSVLKAIASALEVLLTTILSGVLFGTQLDTRTLLAAAIASVGVALYARPVWREQKPDKGYHLVGAPPKDGSERERRLVGGVVEGASSV